MSLPPLVALGSFRSWAKLATLSAVTTPSWLHLLLFVSGLEMTVWTVSFAFTLLTDWLHVSRDCFIDFMTECLNFKIPGNKNGLLILRDWSSYESFESWMIQQVNNTELNIITNCIVLCFLVENHSFSSALRYLKLLQIFTAAVSQSMVVHLPHRYLVHVSSYYFQPRCGPEKGRLSDYELCFPLPYFWLVRILDTALWWTYFLHLISVALTRTKLSPWRRW